MKKVNAELLNTSLNAMIERDIMAANLAGAAAMVSQNGKLVADVRCGFSNAETKTPLLPNALFRYASLTKPVTAVAALLGVQNGWFSLDDPIAKYYPEFKDMYIGKLEDGKVIPDKKAENTLKIYHLLSHSSGLLCGEIGVMQIGAFSPEAFLDIHAAKKAAASTFLSFEPGEGAAYSAYQAFDIIACLLEEKSGMPYADFVGKNIFKPLGIQDITYSPSDEQWSRMVKMHDRAEGNQMLITEMGEHTYERFPLSYTSGGAGLAGTIEDYLVFVEMLCGEGEYNGIRILDKKLIESMRTPHVKMGTPGLSTADSWGLGVRVTVNNAVLPQGCFGWSGAYGGHFWIDPENKIAAVYIKNNRWHDSHGCGNTGREFEKLVMASLDK